MSIVDFASQGTIGTNLRPKRYDVEIYQGDSFDVSCQFLDDSNQPVDLTGITAVVKFVGINGTSQPDAPVVANAPLGSDGIANIQMLDTSGLESPGEYAWDIQLVSGSRKRTYIGGKLTVTKDLTP